MILTERLLPAAARPGGRRRPRRARLHLRRDAWGRGLATEGARALVELAFAALGARRAARPGGTMTVNAASRRVMERCGLRYVRTLHADWGEAIEGSELGDVKYELQRHEWEALSRR